MAIKIEEKNSSLARIKIDIHQKGDGVEKPRKNNINGKSQRGIQPFLFQKNDDNKENKNISTGNIETSKGTFFSFNKKGLEVVIF